MPDFLLELRCEEIPARMQAGARRDLEKLFREQMDDAGVSVGEITVWSTPRRLALIVRDLPGETEAVSEEAKGPPEGAPDKAIDGFCRKNGVTRDELELRDVKGRQTYFAVIEKPGRAVRDVLAEAIPAIVRAFPWPKSMRWGAASISTEALRWVRPLSGIVAIFGEDLVECEIKGIRSGYATKGHRFHHPDDITIGSAADYADKLRACHVIVDHKEREDLIREKARTAAEKAGLHLVEDEGLVVENAGLTEWPIPLLGRFDDEYLAVPPEVIQLTARTNQKYFVCTSPLPPAGGAGSGPETSDLPTPNPSRKREGDLANAFVCTANIEAADGGEAIVAGNRKVLAARLADARFFWEQDLKKLLAEHAEGLERITFHEKLGTVADKVERVAKLARWLVTEEIVTPAKAGMTKQELADLAEQAARLCKADLTTEMVGEFPELQGLMGGYYARAEGLPDEVADAIRDHYKPVGQDDEVPTAPVTVAVSLADKLDTIGGFFSINETPTGSKDPYALRRAALAVGRIAVENGLRMSLVKAMLVQAGLQWDELPNLVEEEVMSAYAPRIKAGLTSLADSISKLPTTQDILQVVAQAMEFFADRLKVQLRESGVKYDLVNAVFALGDEDDLTRLVARAKTLQAFIGTEDGANLLTGYKRAANILKKEGFRIPLRSSRAKSRDG